MAASPAFPMLAHCVNAGAGMGGEPGIINSSRITWIARLLFASVLASLALFPAHATEPLAAIIHIDGEEGAFYPDECCWVEIPRNERLRAAARAESCSALGGPVGRFQLWEDHVWLVGLYRCGGDMPLEEIYPEMEGPTLASWLTGRFTARFDRGSCGGDGWLKPVFFTTHHLVIEQGRVVSVETETLDPANCAGG